MEGTNASVRHWPSGEETFRGHSVLFGLFCTLSSLSLAWNTCCCSNICIAGLSCLVSYGIGIYILNLLIEFLSPKGDPELEALDGVSLPTKESDEFKPFVRRLPDFSSVFWPILLFYWMIVLFVLTMKRPITHMIKYRYIPFDFGKKRYAGKKFAESITASSKD